MPYLIVRDTINGKSGYRVKEIGKEKYLSKGVLTLEQAKKQATAIDLAEEKQKFQNYSKGIAKVPGKGNFDHVAALLQPGEIVIPKKHAGRVRKILKEEKIKLPGL